jgi:hypothetical protein
MGGRPGAEPQFPFSRVEHLNKRRLRLIARGLAGRRIEPDPKDILRRGATGRGSAHSRNPPADNQPDTKGVTMAADRLLVHNVYFALKDNSPEAVRALLEACRKYLTGHPGEVFFAAGTLAEELNRPVNDREFDVALHIVFRDQAAHDLYQEAARHLQFIEENKGNWKKVRVFDSVAGRS